MTDTKPEIIKPTIEVIDVPFKKTHRLFAVIALISIILSLSVAGLLFYIYKSNTTANILYEQKIKTLSQQFSSQAEQQSKQYQNNQLLNDQVKQLKIQLLNTQNKNKLYSADIQALQRNIAESNVRHPNDWILSEVEYLINLAGRKLWLEHDLTTSISLLVAAEQRLVEMRDPSLNPLRRALLEDINKLEALPHHDVDGAVLALASLERRIDKLVLFDLNKPDAKANINREVSSDINDWKVNLTLSWNTFVESIIQTSHRNVPIDVLLSPELSWYLKENLRNHLFKAEFALYREQQELYDVALENAVKLIEFYYDISDEETKQFQLSIKRLSKQKVSAVYPDQFKSAPLLSRIIKQRINRSLAIDKVE